MADPFSVAASAVSVVSLGIQVCQGLLSYYSDYKSYDDDISSLCRKIEDLRSTLEICADILQKPGLTASKASANVAKNMDACKDGLDSLQKSLDSCQKTPRPQGLKGNIHNYGHRTLYPFKKSNVLQLQCTVVELQENLHTALLALQTEGLLDQNSTLAVINANSISGIKQGKSIHDGIERIERSIKGTCSVLPGLRRQGEVSSSSLQAVRDDLQSIHRDIGEHYTSSMGSFASLNTNLARNSSTLESIILARLDEIARQNLALRDSWDRSSELNFIRATRLERDVKSIQLGLLQKPSLLKSVYEQAKSREPDDMTTKLMCRTNKVPSDPQMRRTWADCACRYRSRRQQYSKLQASDSKTISWSISIHSANRNHDRDCPLSVCVETSWSMRLSLASCTKFLARAVEASLSLTRGAGGIALSPNLQLRCVVPYNSPAFTLMREPYPDDMTFDDTKIAASQRMQILRQMFQEGRASPYDVCMDGNTLLHYAVTAVTTYTSSTFSNAEDRLNFNAHLVGQMHLLGVPVNDVNNRGETVMHGIITYLDSEYRETIKQSLSLCVTEIMDLGAEFPSFEQSPLNPTWIALYLGHLMTKINDIAEGLGCNNISLAIIRKSEADLRQALKVSPSSIDETNGIGQTALHLAVEWPRGMNLLLQAGADAECRDYCNSTPLLYAIDMSLVEPIRILALADCSLLDDWFAGLSLKNGKLPLERAVAIEIGAHVDRRQTSAAEMVVNLLVDMIVDRRQRLYDLAKSALPVTDSDRLCHETHLPDESASQLYSALERHGTAVPLALAPGEDGGTLFHQIKHSSRVAERLWKAGFRSIDGRDPLGRTPLMSSPSYDVQSPHIITQYLEYAAWLVEKGADLYAKQDLTWYYELYRHESQLLSVTALHFVSYYLGSSWKWVSWNRLRNWLEENCSVSSKEMLQRILMDNDSDACLCACSVGGCTTFTVLAKSYMGNRSKGPSLVDLWPIVTNFCGPSKIPEFLRIMTFEELDMTHTCCFKNIRGWYWKTKDKAEIDEIRDEEAEDLQKLEELLEEFEAKRTELDIPFDDFITEYWQPRMDEVRNEGTLDEDALREIGVKVY
ncbi:hypothetical protein BDR22DRAFT_960096 [Usnea florida]